MGKLNSILIAGFVGTAVVVGLATAARSVKESNVTRRDKPLLKQIEQLKSQYPAGQPRADAPQVKHDFGILNPATTASHTFVIRNTGPVPLELKKGPTTCKCTVSNLSRSTVLPGQDSDLTLEWNTGRSDAEFQQSAKLYTDDPDQPEIDFEIFGKVRVALAAEPQELVFPTLLPGRTQSAETLVCSQQWPSFSISKIESNIEGLTWKVTPLVKSELLEIDATSGFRIVVSSPMNLAEDWLFGTLQVTAQGPNPTEPPESLELSVGGRRGKPVAVYGDQIDEMGVVDFGLLQVGQGAKTSLMLRVRDKEPQLVVRELRVSPDFVLAKVRPIVDAAGVPKPRLYYLDLEVPRDTPPCVHQGIHQSLVTLDLEQPRMAPLTIRLNFSVKSSQIE